MFKVFSVILLFISFLHFESVKAIEFRITPDLKTQVLGGEIIITGELIGKEINSIFNVKGEFKPMTYENHFLKETPSNEFSFSTRFKFKASSLGKHIIGPFKVSFQGVEYESNAIEVEVIKQPSDIKIDISINKKTVKVGEKFSISILMESKSLFNSGETLFESKDSNWESLGTSTSNSKAIKEGISTNSSTTTFQFTINKEGEYKIPVEYFKGLPTNYKYVPLSITVVK